MRAAFLSTALFGIRHGLFLLAATGVLLILWTVLYFALLILALFTSADPGSPVAYPFGVLIIAGLCLIIGGGIFAPACGVGLAICKVLRWPTIAGIPFVCVSALGFAWLLGLADASGSETGVPLAALARTALWLALPLGLYWWLVEGPWAIGQLLLPWASRAVAKLSAFLQKARTPRLIQKPGHKPNPEA